MDPVDRLLFATGVLAILYSVGIFLFFIGRTIADTLLESLGKDELPALLVWGVVLYPAVLVYGFAVNPIAGFVLLVPVAILLAFPELEAIWVKGKPAVGLPDQITLTEPVQTGNGKHKTRVMIDGEYWSAEIETSGGSPPIVGQTLKVVSRSGTTIRLAEWENS